MTGNYIGAFYVGLGDRFDDDQRFVHETALALVPQIRLAQGTGLPTHWRAEYRPPHDTDDAAILPTVACNGTMVLPFSAKISEG